MKAAYELGKVRNQHWYLKHNSMIYHDLAFGHMLCSYYTCNVNV